MAQHAQPLAGATPIPPDVARRAVEWLVELQSDPVPEPVRAAWAHWRTQSPVHEQAWQRIEAVNGRFAGLATPAGSAVARATLAPPGSARRRHAIQTLAVLLFAGGVGWKVEQHTPWRTWAADHNTGVGEQQAITLEDGTQLVLNTGSAINVRFAAHERRVQLVAGEVLITTAKDSLARPFLVETPQGEAQALGTRFTVRDLGNSTQVAVYEGAVQVRPRQPGAQARVLQAGEQTRFTAVAADTPQPADEARTAWADGTLVARGMRLDDFLAELGRYSPHPLSCDPAVAAMRVSGSYPLANIDKILDTLSATLGLQMETVTRFWGRQVVRVSLAPRGKVG